MLRAATVVAVLSLSLLTACSQAQNDTMPPSPPMDSSTPPSAGLTDAQRQAALAALPAPYNQANLDNGQARFALCRACHTITQGGGTMTGPNLFGVVGRRAGAVAGFSYSDGLRNAGYTWDGPHLDAWLTHPQQTIPGTRMTFAGLPSADDRRDVIAYLMVNGAPPPAAGAANQANTATNSAP